MPVWFEWEPENGTFWVIARKKSQWAAVHENNPKVGMTIDDDAHRCRKVTVQGIAESSKSQTSAGNGCRSPSGCRSAISGENGPEYLVPTLDKPRWLFKIVPDHIPYLAGRRLARTVQEE